MQTLERLRRQRRVAEDLHSVVGTMKGLAAVSVRRYQRAVDALDDYVATIELAMRVVLRHQPDLLTGADPVPRDRVAVVFGSDQGLCGPVNRQVADHAHHVLGAARTAPDEPHVVAVGVRLASELERAGLRPAEIDRQPGSVEAMTPAVQDLLVRVDQWRHGGAGRRIVLIHPRPRAGTGATYEPVAVALWPLDPRALAALAARPWPTRMLPDHRLPWWDLFAGLVRERLFATAFRAYAETAAAVDLSRLAAMQAAEQNIETRLEELGLQYHQLRQSAITEELLDVTAGFEALGGV
jgi:F-type H+-transporting ATPase subunit gamma